MGAVIRACVWLIAAAATAQTTIGVVADIHAPCYPGGQTGKALGTTACNNAKTLADVVLGWNADYMMSLGDLAMHQGNRSEIYKGVRINSLTDVAPGSVTITVDADVAIFGTSAIAGGPYYLPVNTWLAVDAGTANFELVKATAVDGDHRHITATFAKSHTAPFSVVASSDVFFEDYIQRGKYLPVLGNHDGYSGGDDYCNDDYDDPACTNDGTFTAMREAFPSLFPSLSYYTQTIDLMTLFGTDTEGFSETPADGRATSVQGQWFLNTAMPACSTRWCIALAHEPPYSSFGGYSYTNSQWAAGPNIDLVLSGHVHFAEWIKQANYAGDRTIDYVTIPTMASNQVGAGPGAPVTGQQEVWGPGIGAALMTVGWRNLTVAQYDSAGALKFTTTITKTKLFPLPGAAEPR